MFYWQNTSWRSFINIRLLRRSSIEGRPFWSFLCREDLLEIIYIQNTSQRCSIDRWPLVGLPKTKYILEFFYGRRIFWRFSINRRPLKYIFKLANLLKIFLRYNTSLRSSIERSHLENLPCKGVIFTTSHIKSNSWMCSIDRMIFSSTDLLQESRSSSIGKIFYVLSRKATSWRPS